MEKLEKREIKPTAMRLLILKAMTRFTRAFSLLDLETELDTVDKSTIFRTINLFLDHHLIHVIDDGSGSIDDLHAHFYCRNCHKTFCLRKIHVPTVALPGDFTLESINYVLKGLCAECSSRVES